MLCESLKWQGQWVKPLKLQHVYSTQLILAFDAKSFSTLQRADSDIKLNLWTVWAESSMCEASCSNGGGGAELQWESGILVRKPV